MKQPKAQPQTPVEPKFLSLAVGIFLTLLAAIGYAVTAYPDVGHTDSGELIAASWVLGIAHAPGFPIYTMLGWLWLHFLPVTPAVAMNLFSACTAAIAGFFLFRAVIAFHRRTAFPLSLSIAAFAALLLWQSPLLWRWATTAEVYALNTLWLALALWLITTPIRNRWLWLGILWGASLHTHLVSALFWLPLLLAMQWKPAKKSRWQRNPKHLFQFLLPAIGVYLLGAVFLLLRAQADPPINWGAPATLQRLWYHLTAKQYQVNLLHASWQRRFQLLQENFLLLNEALFWFPLLLAIIGLWHLWKQRQRPMVYGALLSFLLGFAYTASYDIAQDREAYLLPLLLLLCFFAAIGIGALLPKWRQRPPKALFILPLFPLVAAILRFPAMDRSEIRITPTFVEQSLAPVDSTALVLTGNWQLYSPFLYFHYVQGRYPNLILIDIPLWQNRAWYVEQFQKRYPQLAQQWEPALSHFLHYLRKFERDALQSTEAIERWYRELLQAMLEKTTLPVFLDLYAVRHFQQYQVFRHLPVPNQLLFQYRPIPQEPIAFQTMPPIPPDNAVLDPVEEEILQLYQAMQNIHSTFLEPRPQP